MKNVLSMDQGAFPWLPNTSVQPGEILDRLDVPRTGLLHENGTTILFSNILGDGQADGLWAYAAVTGSEVRELLRLEGPEQFDEAVETVMAHRCVTVAYAADYRLRVVESFDAGQEGTEGLVERFSKRMETSIAESQQANESVRHLMPAS